MKHGLIVLVLGACCWSAFGAEGRIEIAQPDMPLVITAPGSYIFTDNLVAVGGAGITVASSNVTIDLNGYTLYGTPGSADGILLETSAARPNLRVRNGTITLWGGDGIDATVGDDVVLEDLVLRNNGGTGTQCRDRARILRVAALDNGDDGLRAGKRAWIEDCTTEGNINQGIDTGYGSVVRNCTALENTVNGIVAGSSSVIEGCTASDNGTQSTHAQIRVSFGSRVADNLCDCNGGGTLDAGISTGPIGIHVTGKHNLLRGNHLVGCGDGVHVDVTTAIDNIVVDNSASANDDDYFISGGNLAGKELDTAADTNNVNEAVSSNLKQ